MFKLTPRFLLSPRFLALPFIALAVLVALAQTTTRPTSTTASIDAGSQKVYRAINCSDPARAAAAACTVAGDTGRVVR